jgi:transposase
MYVLLTELGHEVLVANGRKLRAIYENENKDDDVDAETLARLRRVDPKLLHPVVMKADDDYSAMATLRARDRLVQARTKLINSVRGMVKSTGHRIGSCDANYFHRRRDEIPEELHMALMPMMDCIEKLNEEIRKLDRVIERLCRVVYPQTEQLQQICGVGPVVSLTFVLVLGDPHRFKKSRMVGSYIGLRPKKDKSGQSDPKLRITKCGDRYLRQLLIGSAHYMLGPFGKPSALRDWGLKLDSRGGKGARNRAAVAVARKLAVLMHRLWITGEDYRPYLNGEPKRLVMVKA